MGRFLLLTLAALSAAFAATAHGAGAINHWVVPLFSEWRFDGAYLKDIRPERFKTPHLPFARPLAGGPLKILFIVPKSGARDVVELWQRMDMEFEAVAIAGAEELCDGYPFTTAVIGESPDEKAVELDQKLSRAYDVICLANCALDKLPASSRFKILAAVNSGTGLVGFFGNTRSKLPIHQPTNPSTAGRDVLRGCALAGLPYFAVNDKNPVEKAADAVCSPSQFGDGRIAWLNYGGAPHSQNTWYGGDCMGRPAVSSPQGYDAALALAAKAMLWAARRGPSLSVMPILSDGSELTIQQWPKPFPVTLRRLAENAPRHVTIEARLVRLDGQFEASASAEAEIDKPEKTVTIDLPSPLSGTLFMHLTARDPNGKAVDFSVTSFNVKPKRWIKSISLEREALSPEDTAAAAVALDGEPSIGRLRAEAVDVFGRVFWRGDAPASDTAFKIPLSNACGRYAKLKVSLLAGEDSLQDVQASELFIRREVGHEFINLMWGQSGVGASDWQAAGYLWDLRSRQLAKAGFNTGMNGGVRGCKAECRVNAHWMDYVAHVQDANLRSYFDPAARSKEEKRLEERAREQAPFGTFVYSLGDENQCVTHDDLKPLELEAFREFLKGSYGGDLQALNKAWGTSYVDFGQVGSKPPEGVKPSKALRHDLAAFWEFAYAGTYRWMREAIRRGDPRAQVGAEGSDSGDIELTTAALDWWAPYADRVGNVMTRQLVPPDSFRGNWWGGYTAFHGARGGTSILWTQIASGFSNASNFFCGYIASEGMLSVDLAPADYIEPWLPELDDISATAGPVAKASWVADDGVGIYWSRASEIASDLDQSFGSSKIERADLVRRMDEMGINARFVSERQILAGKLDPKTTTVLLLPLVKAIPDAAIPALERYVAAGGVLIADAAPDLYGAHLADAPPGRLLPLFGAKATGPAKPVAAKIEFNIESATPRKIPLALASGECKVDSSIQVGEGGRSDASVNGAPILISRQHGSGVALLLNFDLFNAMGWARSDKAVYNPGDDFLNSLISQARPSGRQGWTLPPQPGLPWATIQRMRHADADVVGLAGWRGGKGGKTFTAGKGRRLHVLRLGVAPDTMERLELPPESPGELLVAVLPELERKIRVKTVDGVKPGGKARHDVILEVGGKRLADSLLRVDVKDPDGKQLPAHRQFLLSKDRAIAVEWPVALDAKPGKYVVTVAELVSGAAESSTIDIAK